MENTKNQNDIAKGTFTYLLGLPGKLAGFLVIWIAAKYYGELSLGIYFGSWALIQILLKLTGGGISEGLTIKLSQLIPKDQHDNNNNRPKEVYQILSNSIYIGIVLSVISIIGVLIGLDLIIELGWINISEKIAFGLKLFLCIIPLNLAIQIFVSSTRALLKFKHDMLINSIIKQTLFLLLTLLGIAFNQSLYTLIIIQIIVHILAFGIAAKGFSDSFKIKKCLNLYPIDKSFTKLIFPLSINDLLGYLTQELDIIMITAYGIINEEKISFYGVALGIVFGIRMLRRNLLKVFLPIGTQLISEKKWVTLNATFNQSMRWINYMIIPLLGFFILFNDILLNLYNDSYIRYSNTFIILAISAFINSFLGIYGTLILCMGKTKLVLINSSINVGLNIVFNLALIPLYGLFGAALATLLGIFTSHLLMYFEVKHYLKKVQLHFSSVKFPLYWVFLASGLVLVSRQFSFTQNQLFQLILFASALVLFLIFSWVHPEDKALFQKSRNKILKKLSR